MDQVKSRLLDSIGNCDGLEDLQQILIAELSNVSKAIHHEKICQSSPKKLIIVHFNDVYNIASRETEPVGGASRFKTAINQYRKGGSKYTEGIDPVILFSGDAFNPSTLSVVTRGNHMVHILNSFGIDAACYGNHDFDFGIEQLEENANASNFPWLISNVVLKQDKKPLAKGLSKLVVEASGGIKIGLMGLVEHAWLSTLSMVDEDDVIFEDFVSCGRRIAMELRNLDGVDIVIALTHMRIPNDTRLAKEAGDCIDIILGGHDHDYFKDTINDTFVIKSGTDFREFSVVNIEVSDTVKVVDSERVEINSSVVEDEFLADVVSYFDKKASADETKIIGESCVPIDARFAFIRTCETNAANFIADIMRVGCQSDIAILNSGTIRLDDIVPPGVFTLGHLRGMLPMADELIVLSMTGKMLLEALENGVSKYPQTEGRFPCISGVTFKFDSNKPPHSRVVESSLDPSKTYTVATKAYLAQGKDGYDVFTQGSVIRDAEECPMLAILVRNHFLTISAINGFAMPRKIAKKSIDQVVMKAAMKFKHMKEISCDSYYKVKPIVDGRIINIANSN